jgi:hypothetical protein
MFLEAAHEANSNAGYPAGPGSAGRIAVSAAPVVLEGRYRLLMRALWELRHSRVSCRSASDQPSLVMLGLIDSAALAPLAASPSRFRQPGSLHAPATVK